MKAPSRPMATALLAVSTILLTFLILEGIARVALRSQGGGKETQTALQYTEYDPVLGWVKRAGASARFERREYTVDVRINRRGLRDPEREYEAPAGTVRILALGDSFLEGYTVPLGSTVTQALESRLGTPTCRVEVINGGTGGYSTDQEYLFYENEGVRYGPKVVLLFFYYNDVRPNAAPYYFGQPKPVLEKYQGRLVVHGPVARPAPRPVSTPPTADVPEAPASVLYDWVRSRVRTAAPRTYNTLAGFGLWPAIPRAEPFLELKVFRRRPLPELEEAWEQTALILSGLKREVEGRGAHFLVVYVPSRMEVSDRDWELTRLRYGWDEVRWDRGLVLSRLRDVARTAAIDLLDLTPALKKADRGVLGGPYYVYDGHWNVLGHRVAAAEIESELRRRSLVPGCASPPSASAPAVP